MTHKQLTVVVAIQQWQVTDVVGGLVNVGQSWQRRVRTDDPPASRGRGHLAVREQRTVRRG